MNAEIIATIHQIEQIFPGSEVRMYIEVDEETHWEPLYVADIRLSVGKMMSVRGVSLEDLLRRAGGDDPDRMDAILAKLTKDIFPLPPKTQRRGLSDFFNFN